jgi:hypothetical protein
LAARTTGVERRLYGVPESAKDHSPHDAPCLISKTFEMPDMMALREQSPHRSKVERDGYCMA